MRGLRMGIRIEANPSTLCVIIVKKMSDREPLEVFV